MDDAVRAAFEAWYSSGVEQRYTFWKGVRTIKYPCDMWVFQEIIHETRPDVILETGSAHGGSAHFYADLGVEVHSVDVAPPKAPAPHPLVTYYRGFSTDPRILYYMEEAARGRRVMVFLDSNHSKENVLAELDVYARFVTTGCYLIVEDTHLGKTTMLVEYPDGGPGHALDEWLPNHPEFTVDRSREKHGITMHSGGFLRRD